MKFCLPVLIVVTFMSCLYMYKPPEIITSPSGLYKFRATINNDKSDSAKYECVVLTLYDSSYKQISMIQTRASNTMKWAAGWCPKKDIIILYSQDIGTYAYQLSDKKVLDTIHVTNEVENAATIIFNKKYKNQ